VKFNLKRKDNVQLVMEINVSLEPLPQDVLLAEEEEQLIIDRVL
jgi:hypothetical protein